MEIFFICDKRLLMDLVHLRRQSDQSGKNVNLNVWDDSNFLNSKSICTVMRIQLFKSHSKIDSLQSMYTTQ